jgi:hypothetical protein
MAIIKPNNNTISAITALPAAIPTGKVLQVKHNMISSRYLVSGNGTLETIWTGDTLTLSNSSNKVLVLGSFSVGGDRGGAMALQFSTDGGSNYSDITTADMGNNDSNLDGKAVLGFHNNFSSNANASMQSSFNYLHAPSNTSAKYRLRIAGQGSSYAISINRRDLDSDYGGLSWVTQMEVSA